jgi:hypothetical protein
MIEQLRKLRRTLRRCAKDHECEAACARANIICRNLEIVEQRPDDVALRRLVVSEIDELNLILRR